MRFGSLFSIVANDRNDIYLTGYRNRKNHNNGKCALIFILAFRDKNCYKFVIELFNKIQDDYCLYDKYDDGYNY